MSSNHGSSRQYHQQASCRGRGAWMNESTTKIETFYLLARTDLYRTEPPAGTAGTPRSVRPASRAALGIAGPRCGGTPGVRPRVAPCYHCLPGHDLHVDERLLRSAGGQQRGRSGRGQGVALDGEAIGGGSSIVPSRRRIARAGIQRSRCINPTWTAAGLPGEPAKVLTSGRLLSGRGQVRWPPRALRATAARRERSRQARAAAGSRTRRSEYRVHRG
jgi:hypothetical protein